MFGAFIHFSRASRGAYVNLHTFKHPFPLPTDALKGEKGGWLCTTVAFTKLSRSMFSVSLVFLSTICLLLFYHRPFCLLSSVKSMLKAAASF